MICQECNEHVASLHLTTTSNGDKLTLHICEECAKKKGIFKEIEVNKYILNNLLATFMTNEVGKQAQHKEIVQQMNLNCEACGSTLNAFKKSGKFGCTQCYDSFCAYLLPLLKRLHGGNSEHIGKVPKTLKSNLHMKREIKELRVQLEKVVKEEEFEKAAILRDEIRALQQKLGL